MVLEMLKYVLREILAYVQIVKAQYLPGGELYDPDDELWKLTESVPAHTDRIEGVFAHWEQLKRRCPRISMLGAEGQVLAKANDTIGWLRRQPPASVPGLIENARKSVKELEKAAKEKEKAGQADEAEEHTRALAAAAQKEEAAQENADRLLTAIGQIGWWKTADDVDRGLVRVAEKLREDNPGASESRLEGLVKIGRREAVLVQLQALKILTNAARKAPKALFQKSAAGKEYTLEELIRNLLTIYESGVVPDSASREEREPGSLVDEDGEVQVPAPVGGRAVRTDEERLARQALDEEAGRVRILRKPAQDAIVEANRNAAEWRVAGKKRGEADKRAEAKRQKEEALRIAREEKARERAAAREKKQAEKNARRKGGAGRGVPRTSEQLECPTGEALPGAEAAVTATAPERPPQSQESSKQGLVGADQSPVDATPVDVNAAGAYEWAPSPIDEVHAEFEEADFRPAAVLVDQLVDTTRRLSLEPVHFPDLVDVAATPERVDGAPLQGSEPQESDSGLLQESTLAMLTDQARRLSLSRGTVL